MCAQNDLKENLSKTQLVNGVLPWFSGLKFILTQPINAPMRKFVHHVKVF